MSETSSPGFGGAPRVAPDDAGTTVTTDRATASIVGVPYIVGTVPAS